MLKPITMIAFGAMGLAVLVPGLTPEQQPVEEANITREDNIIRAQPAEPAPVKKARKSSSSNFCRSDPDLGVTACRSDDSAPSRPTKKVAVKKSKAKSKDKSAKKNNNKNRGRSYVIDKDEQGHFRAVARMNGTRVRVLVDTGATSVTINESTARRLGINLRDKDFAHEAVTANGKAKYARTKIRNIRIGGIVFDDVEASVLKDKALSTTLLGMSFLNRLTKFQMEGGQLRMVQ